MKTEVFVVLCNDTERKPRGFEKSDGRFHLCREDADMALTAMGSLAQYFAVQPCFIELQTEQLGQFVDRVEQAHTGGNIYVDLVVLKDGRVLGISDDCAVLYKSMQGFEDMTSETKPMIEL